MCGTDYNKNIFRVGPEKAYKYILKHKTIENIAIEAKIDVGVLKHIRGREMFTEYDRVNIDKIAFCGIPIFTNWMNSYSKRI